MAASSSGASPRLRTWVPGLLELPASETRRVQLSVRASWSHIASRLQDRTKVASTVRSAVAEIEGVPDEVLSDMVLRHVRSPFFALTTPSADARCVHARLLAA